MILSTMIFASQAEQLPNTPTVKQKAGVAIIGLSLGWLAFPSLVAGDVQALSLSKAGQCDSDHFVKGYFPIPTQRGSEMTWKFSVPCNQWPDNNNVLNKEI